MRHVLQEKRRYMKYLYYITVKNNYAEILQWRLQKLSVWASKVSKKIYSI